MYRPDSNKCLSFVERLESGHGKVDPGVWNAPSAVRRSRRSRRGCGKAEEWARGARDAAYYRRLERGDRAAVANERGGIFRSLSRDLRKLIGSGTASQTLNGFPAHNRKKLNTGGERHRKAIIPRAYGVQASRVQRNQGPAAKGPPPQKQVGANHVVVWRIGPAPGTAALDLPCA